MSLFQELRRRNVFKVASVYVITAWILMQIIAVISPYLHLPILFGTGITVVLLLAFPIVCIFAWAFELTPEGLKRSHEVDHEESIRHHTGRKMNIILSILLILVVGYFTIDKLFLAEMDTITLTKAASIEAKIQNKVVNNGAINFKDAAKSGQLLFENKNNIALTIAVLPFVNMSADVQQEFFVDGLTEEILNGLAKIKGLLVIGRTTSFAYKNKNMDMRTIAKELNVNYLIEGSVRKSGDKIRITTQLIEAKNGTHLFSETFDRDLVDIFAIQDEISQQVASALKLSLVYQDKRYDTALGKLDYVAVEQLVIARGQIAEYNEKPIKIALKTLKRLNQQYPETAEILGLLAYGKMMLSSTSSISDIDFLDKVLDLAKQTLTISPSNYDALDTLGAIYDDYARDQQLARQTYQNLLRYYPGKKSSYTGMLDFLAYSLSPCSKLRQFVNAIPQNVLPTVDLQAITLLLNTCVNSGSINQLINNKVKDKIQSAALNQRVNYYAWRLRLATDSSYTRAQNLVDKNPNQRYITGLYSYQLAMGAMQQAQQTAIRIDTDAEGFWGWYFSLVHYLYFDPQYHLAKGVRTPKAFIMLMKNEMKNISELGFSLTLIKQAKQENKPELVKGYLATVPNFPIEINDANNSETLGLMAMQYYVESLNTEKSDQLSKHQLSQATAQQFLMKLKAYRLQYPESFLFWGLGNITFITAFYAGEYDYAAEILTNGFNTDYSYWLDDIAVIKVALAPWAEHKTVKAYIKLIEQDRIRARNKFNIN